MEQNKKYTRHQHLNVWINVITILCLAALGVLLVDGEPVYGIVLLVLAGLLLIWELFNLSRRDISLKKAPPVVPETSKDDPAVLRALSALPLPYVQTNRSGDLVWFNESFKDLMGSREIRTNISQIFEGLYKKVFPQQGIRKEIHVHFGERKYCVKCRQVAAAELLGEQAAAELPEYLMEFYFFDETQLIDYREAYKGKNLVAGLIYIDNYEEVLESMEEVRQSLLLALVERKVVKYMHDLNAIIKKFEKDKFIFVFEEKNLELLIESRFSLLDEVRTINIGNDLSVTLSISVGVNAPGYLETYESARIAMDLALGRGGDQAVVRDGDTISYYGGKTARVEKSTRVKARVKAHALRELMLTHDTIFIMGHKIPDADCIGSALGIYRLAKTFNKRVYIVMDEDSPAIEPIVSVIRKDRREGDEDIFISGDQALNLRDRNSMLVMVDVNRPAMTECPDLVRLEKTIVVLDHHRQTNDTIKNALVSYVEPYASSACEMVAEILQYIPDKPRLKPIEADALYSGILVDTDNFVIKAGVRTFEAAAYLRRAGADVTRVRKMFREDMEDYRMRTEIISAAEVYLDEFAISTFDAADIPGATVIGAKAANSLLDVQGIRGSFVITRLTDWIYISARSIDDLNVQVIMEKFGGGGHLTVAAAQVKNSSMEEVRQELKNLLLNMKQDGDI
ncbi:MAG: DHH family phosphoesterase [Eubacterium sp.]|nr:DHH family phosphoesterase [Eubacterium sp.]